MASYPSLEITSVELSSDPVSKEKWELAARIVASQPFRKSPQLRAFLLYVTERALTGRLNEISEHEIGRRVFGRSAAFNPHEDTIVRVQARRLRAKLEEYFYGFGTEERLLVTIPKGTYVPKFEEKPPETPPELEAIPEPHAVSPGLVQQPASRTVPWAWMQRVLLFFATFAAGYAVAHGFHYRASQSGPAAANPLLASVFSRGEGPKVVTSDSGFVLLQDTLHRSIALEDYARPDFPRSLLPLVSNNNDALREVLRRCSERSYTNYGDVNSIAQLVLLGRQAGALPLIRHPRQLNKSDFETGSFVLLGGRIANPWYSLFEPRLNFVFEIDPGSGETKIRNRNPDSGEQPYYVPLHRRNGEVTFSILSLVPNLHGTGSILMLAGVDRPGTEGAEDLVLRPQLRDDLLSIWKEYRNQNVPFEVLLKTYAIAGVPQETSVVARRAPRE